MGWLRKIEFFQKVKKMRTPKLIRALFTFLAVFFTGCFSLSAYGLTVKTDIHSQYSIKEPGAINMEIDITNTGTATVYDVVATITIADWAEPYDELGDNPPGGKINIKSRYVNPRLKPGKYLVTVLVHFEERGGATHRKYHFFEIAYRLDKASSDPPRVSVDLKSPIINKKIMWGQKRNILVSIKNHNKKPVKAHVHFCLPDGLATYEPSRFYRLSPKKEIADTIPLILRKRARDTNTYKAVVWYEQNGTHYSELLKGKIRVVSKPVYFRWYLVLGITVLLIFSVLIYYRGKRR